VVCYREFGWTPAELRDVPLSEIETILTCLREEVRYQNRPKGAKTKTLASTA
jgi:hypothetical protein